MPRSLSGPIEDTDNPHVDRIGQAPYEAEKKSFTSAKYQVKRTSNSLDRRKLERTVDLALSSSNGKLSSANITQEVFKRPLNAEEVEETLDKMADARNGRRWRTRSLWKFSLSMLISTALAVALLLSIIRAFATRQLDPKGCDMCWSRPIYIKFSDFDTEHTRFASKYSLYMLREGGFDEDPKV